MCFHHYGGGDWIDPAVESSSQLHVRRIVVVADGHDLSVAGHRYAPKYSLAVVLAGHELVHYVRPDAAENVVDTCARVGPGGCGRLPLCRCLKCHFDNEWVDP